MFLAILTVPLSPISSPPLLTPGETVRQQALRLLSLPPLPDQCGKGTVKFNHYNKAFPIHNSVMQWVDVDEEYSFSFVFKGEPIPACLLASCYITFPLQLALVRI